MSNNELFPHNKEMAELSIKKLEEDNIACFVQSTGAGKSYVIDEVIGDKKALFVAPRHAIMEQWRREHHTDSRDIDYTTYASLKNIESINGFDIVVFDEMHRIGAPKWGLEAMRLRDDMLEHGRQVFGATATPIHNKKGCMINRMFNGHLVKMTHLHDSFEDGILKPPKYVAVQYRMDEVVIKLEDEINANKSLTGSHKKDMLKKLKVAKLKANDMIGVGKIVNDRLPKNPKGIIFVSSILQLEEVKQDVEVWFSDKKQISVDTVCYKDNNAVQKIMDFSDRKVEDGSISILIAVDMMNEGVHAPGINFVMFLRNTKSLILYLQQLGRVLAAGSEEDTVVFDMVNNVRLLTELPEMLGKIRKEQLTVVRHGEHRRQILEIGGIEVEFSDPEFYSLVEQAHEKHRIWSMQETINYLYIKHTTTQQAYEKSELWKTVRGLPRHPEWYYNRIDFWDILLGRVSVFDDVSDVYKWFADHGILSEKDVTKDARKVIEDSLVIPAKYKSGRSNGFWRQVKSTWYDTIRDHKGVPSIILVELCEDLSRPHRVSALSEKYNISTSLIHGMVSKKHHRRLTRLYTFSPPIAGNTKDSIVLSIVEDWVSGKFSVSAIAKKYKLVYNTVYRILRRESHTNITKNLKFEAPEPHEKIDEQSLMRLYAMVKEGKNSRDIATEFNLSMGYASKLMCGRHKQKQFKKYFPDGVVSNDDIRKNKMIEVLELLQNTTLTQKEISERTGINAHTVSQLVCGATHLELSKDYDLRHRKRVVKKLTYRGVSKTVAEWAEELSVKKKTLSRRMWSGWSDEEVLTIPVGKHRREGFRNECKNKKE